MKVISKKSTLAIAGLGALSVAFGTAEAQTLQSSNPRTNSRVGNLDVSVDYQHLADEISRAEAEGIQVFRDSTMVRVDNAEKTQEYTQEAIDYYKKKTEELSKVISRYQKDKADYEQKVKTRQAEADAANAELNAFKLNLTSLGGSVAYKSQTYSPAAKEAGIQTLKEAVARGEKIRDIKNAITSFESLQNSYGEFQINNIRGDVKINRENVTVSGASQIKEYETRIQNAYQEMTKYVDGLDPEKEVDEASKPTYTLYNITVDTHLMNDHLKPVEVPSFEPTPTDKVKVPQFTYAFYDIRQASDLLTESNNRDGEKIVIKSTDDATGGNIHQAMVNQTVAIVSTNDPLPAGRFDKYHALTVKVHIPDEAQVELNEELTSARNTNWKYSFDKDTRTVTFTATDEYLVDINENQKIREGTIGGIMAEPFHYEVPSVYVKLLKDEHKYTFSSTVMINHEYKANSGKTFLQTSKADPEKHNYNDKGVVIDGKTVWFGSTNNYTVTWDFDQYAGSQIDKGMKEVGTHLIDFYPAEAVDFTGEGVVIKHNGNIIARGNADGSFTDVSGTGIKGVTWSRVTSHPGIDKTGPAVKVSMVGADNPWFERYVESGQRLEVVFPMKTKVVDHTPGVSGGLYGGNTFTNVAYQSDFGNIYKTNEVTNTAATLDPRKDAVIAVSQLESLDLKANPDAEIEHNTFFQYRLSGSKLQLDVLEGSPRSYSMTDYFHEADQYDGIFFAESNGNIVFKEGTALYNKYRNTQGLLPENTDISKFITQTITRNVSANINTKTGTVFGADAKLTKVVYNFDQDFLDQIDYTKSTFQVDVFAQAKRAKNVDNVTNVFQEEVNGLSFDSTEVLTNTKTNKVDDLAGKIDKVDKDVKDVREEFTSALSVVRKNIRQNTDAINQNKRDQDKVNEAVAEKLAEHHDKIEENTSQIVSIRRLVAANKAEVDTLLSQEDSELIIYTPTVRSNSDALTYAVNHGVASRSIKEIKLNEENRFVVVYNTSANSITGGPKAADKPVNVIPEPIKIEAPATRKVTITFFTDDYKALFTGNKKLEYVSNVSQDGVVTFEIPNNMTLAELNAYVREQRNKK